MSSIMKIRQARNAQQIASELEPLAESLATLADQAQTSIKNMEEASFRQAQEWSSQQLNAATEVESAAKSLAQCVKALQQTTADLQQTTEEIQQSQRNQLWTLMSAVFISTIVAAMLSIELWIWLGPVPQVQNSLDSKTIAEHLKPAIVDALKRR